MNRFIKSRLMPAVDPISIRLCQDMSNAAFKCLKNALGLTEECWGILLQIGFTQSINCTLSTATVSAVAVVNLWQYKMSLKFYYQFDCLISIIPHEEI